MNPTPKIHIVETEEFLGQKLFLYDESTGNVHEFNDGAAIVWYLCDGTRDKRTIATEIAAACNIPKHQIYDRVCSAIAQFHELELLETEDC